MEVLKTLLAHECSVDFQDRHGNTPLHVACKDGNMPIVVALCEASCSLDISNKVSVHSGSLSGLLLGLGQVSVCSSAWLRGSVTRAALSRTDGALLNCPSSTDGRPPAWANQCIGACVCTCVRAPVEERRPWGR
jgi:ankyrin repeat protein